MKRLVFFVGVVLLCAGGCLKTYRYENSQVVNADLSSDGSLSFGSHGEGQSRQ